MLVSVVIPCFNSEKSIKDVVELSKKELVNAGYDYEFVLANDYSRDNTFNEIEKLCDEDIKVKGIDLARNFGQHNAIMSALNFVTGDIVVAMDDDLQTHPSQMIKILNGFRDGYDVVYGVYKKQKQNIFRRVVSYLNTCTYRIMIGQPKDISTSSFWAAKRFVIDEIIRYKNPFTQLRGLIFRTTKNIGNVEIEHFNRKYGKSNYNLIRMFRLWGNFISFSIIPLRIFMFSGIFVAFIGFIMAMYIIISKLLGASLQTGWPSVISTVLIMSGINLFAVGIIGEYVGKIFMCINNEPQFVIRKSKNINK